MMNRSITYNFNEDCVLITLSNEKKHLGKEDFQDGVYLYKNSKDEIVEIEIFEFVNFSDTKIQLSSKKYLNLFESFRMLRMAISLGDIMFSEDYDVKREFEETCKKWEIEIKLINKKNNNPFFVIPLINKID